jgi:ribosomal-protein-alanine N-acetyltransferase
MPDLIARAQRGTLWTTLATPADLDSLVRLEEQSFSAPWTRRMFETELTGNPFAQFWAARVRGAGGEMELVGYICFWVVFEELRVMNVAVAPPWRRQGIARELLHQALRHGQRQGARRALLEVRASNLAGIQLYQLAGFRVWGRRQGYYSHPTEDAILMGLDPIEMNY